VALEATDNAPILLVCVVRMIVTPSPLVLSQVEHLSTAFGCSVRSLVIQYVPMTGRRFGQTQYSTLRLFEYLPIGEFLNWSMIDQR
jgi:hypothetical protein